MYNFGKPFGGHTVPGHIDVHCPYGPFGPCHFDYHVGNIKLPFNPYGHPYGGYYGNGYYGNGYYR